jgi:hypothetical protein
MHAIAEPDGLERVERGTGRLCHRCTPERERQLDVLACGQEREQARLLGDERDVLAPIARTLGAAELRDDGSQHRDLAVRRELEPREQMQQRRLPGSGRAGDDMQLSRTELTGHAPDRGRAAVALDHVAQLRHGDVLRRGICLGQRRGRRGRRRPRNGCACGTDDDLPGLDPSCRARADPGSGE